MKVKYLGNNKIWQVSKLK